MNAVVISNNGQTCKVRIGRGKVQSLLGPIADLKVGDTVEVISHRGEYGQVRRVIRTEATCD